jgi:chitin disaccharide deacetylase
MLIINADDWGRSRAETDSALTCYDEGRITSATAMVYMEDSERAAELAKSDHIGIGLHLNFTERFAAKNTPANLRDTQQAVAGFLRRSKYALLVYNPILRRRFRYLYQAQVEEFLRLYGTPPSHMDGHHHLHLCSNMLLDDVIPAGEKVRRSFSFWPGEKSVINRAYRRLVDTWLVRRYRLTDFFFSLIECLETDRLSRVTELAGNRNVELMTHPVVPDEYAFLMSDRYIETMGMLQKGSYRLL